MLFKLGLHNKSYRDSRKHEGMALAVEAAGTAALRQALLENQVIALHHHCQICAVPGYLEILSVRDKARSGTAPGTLDKLCQYLRRAAAAPASLSRITSSQ